MDLQHFDADTMNEPASENTVSIGLLLSNPADRRLLVNFLQQLGYRVRAAAPPEVSFDDWAEISLIITGERAARLHRLDLLALKQQGGFFLPLLIALPQNAESAPWLAAGFDDVLRLPLRKAELAARVEMYLRLRAQSEESRRLAQQVVLAQEAERQRLARELHDEVGQALTAVNLNLQALNLSISDAVVTEHLRESLVLIEHTLNQVRDLSLDLHPSILDDLGLVAALQWYLDRQAERAGLQIELSSDVLEMNMPRELKSTCFRVIQEAITNIVRHADAKHVQVELKQHKTELELIVRDDGCGFEVESARRRALRGSSLGLLGMQERVALIKGRLSFHSADGEGTEVRARFPLAPQANPAQHTHKKERQG